MRPRYRGHRPGRGFRNMRPSVEDESDNAQAENKDYLLGVKACPKTQQSKHHSGLMQVIDTIYLTRMDGFPDDTRTVHFRIYACRPRAFQFSTFGTDGTIHVDSQPRVWAGRRGDTELSEVPNPPETQARYRVEEQFTNAIRGTEIVDMVAFETGVHYMEWTEAVYRSAMTGQAVYLPP